MSNLSSTTTLWAEHHTDGGKQLQQMTVDEACSIHNISHQRLIQQLERNNVFSIVDDEQGFFVRFQIDKSIQPMP